VRLTAELSRARLAQRVAPCAKTESPVQFVDSADLLHHDSNHPVSHEKIREVISSRSAAVWIGGSEPLRTIPALRIWSEPSPGAVILFFLKTDGTLLRRRIHEFQPVARFFLTVRLEIGARHEPSKGLPAKRVGVGRRGPCVRRGLSGF